jgi:hypothetical protein
MAGGVIDRYDDGMVKNDKVSPLEWGGIALFGFGALATIGSSEWAEKTHQYAYWSGYAMALPAFFAGAALLIWSNRRRRP